MLTVRFIRHGESLSNSGGMTAIYEEIPLTEVGFGQAQAVAETLTQAPELFVVSPYLRTRQTAAPTLAKFPQVPVEIWPVQEFRFLGDNHFSRPTDKVMRAPLSEAFWADPQPDKRDGPGAETFAEFIGRCQAALKRLEAAEKKGLPNAVCFSHGQFMMALRMLVENPNRPIDSTFMRDFWAEKTTRLIPNTGGFSLVCDGSWKVLG